MKNLQQNLNLPINLRKSEDQRNSEIAYSNKLQLLQSIHDEIDAKNSDDDKFDNSPVDGNNTRYLETYTLGTI